MWRGRSSPTLPSMALLGMSCAGCSPRPRRIQRRYCRRTLRPSATQLARTDALSSPTISIQLGSFARSLGLQQPAARGRSAAVLRPVLRAADDRWWRAAYVNGFASGEAIIGRLSGHHDDDPENVTGERRALIFEPEFARLLTVNNRDGSTSSPILRGAWDDGRLQLIRAKSSLLAEGTHVSIVAHITPGNCAKSSLPLKWPAASQTGSSSSSFVARSAYRRAGT